MNIYEYININILEKKNKDINILLTRALHHENIQ